MLEHQKKNNCYINIPSIKDKVVEEVKSLNLKEEVIKKIFENKTIREKKTTKRDKNKNGENNNSKKDSKSSRQDKNFVKLRGLYQSEIINVV